jgi:hypothetical protein
VIVKDGEVHLWGLVRSEDERKALVVLAEGVPGVTNVVDENFPQAGRTLRPLLKATVRGASKINQKTRAVVAEP